MEQRLSLVTIGVADLQGSREFYEELGWSASVTSSDEIVFFQVGSLVFALWDRSRLAEDSGTEDSGGWGGVTLAHNVDSRVEVDRVLGEARSAGADVPREAAETSWGGYSGVFIDPDGHPWEVAHNPDWPLAADGAVTLPG